MRLTALLLTGILAAAPAAAQSGQPSSSANGEPSASPVAAPQAVLGGQESASRRPTPVPPETTTSDLPVSLDRIREALDKPVSRPLMKSFDEQPTFRVEIRERLRIEELLAALDFKGGPTPAAGIYGYEQQQRLFPPSMNPLAQPYAAFNQGQLITILIENLVGKYLAGHAASSISKSLREHAEAVARREVDEAIAEYCAARPDRGAGIALCAATPPQARR